MRAQMSAVCASVARSMKTRATCHAATAAATLHIAMLVREKRVAMANSATPITSAAVIAGGIA